MGLRTELAEKSRVGDIKWLNSLLPQVINQFQNSETSTLALAAETCTLWANRFNKEWTTGQPLPSESMIDELICLVIDRWSQGDPSYKAFLKKFMQHIFVLREKHFNHNNFAPLVLHAAKYSKDDQRICYGALDCIARSSEGNCNATLAALPPHFIEQSFAALVLETSSSNLIGRCLVALLGKAEPTVWYEYTNKYISSTETYQAVMTYFIQPILKQHRQATEVFTQYFELCDSLAGSDPSVEIGVLKAAKNAKLDVGELVLSSTVVKQSLVSPVKALRYDALQLLCSATRKLTSPVPPVIVRLIIASSSALLAEGDPKSRSDVYSALKNLIIRMKKSNSDATELTQFMSRWCSDNLVSGAPYRCLSMATRLLEILCDYEDVINNQNVVHGLLNGIVSDFADIREACVQLLSKVKIDLGPQLKQMQEIGFRLVASSRGGDAGARILEFLHFHNKSSGTEIGDKLAEELQEKLKLAAIGINKVRGGIYGYFISLRLIPSTQKIIPLVREAWTVCSPPLMALAPEGMDEATLNFCWKTIKECALTIEKCSDEEILEANPTELLDSMAYMLSDMTHWGAFSAIPPAFIAVAKRCPDYALELVWHQLKELESRAKSRSVTRRSAGLPMLITSSLTAKFDSKIVDALFKLATLPFVDGEQEELEMPQVHGMNCLRAVLTDTELTKQTTNFIESAVQLSLQQFRSESWSLRNCAAMMFTNLFKRLFGVQAFKVPASVFFQRYKSLKGILLAQILLIDVGEHPVFPALAVLAQLQTTSASDETLAMFWEPIIPLLGSKSWKIREMAARVADSMTHADNAFDTAVEFIANMNPTNVNEMHGYAMLVNRLLTRCSTKSLDTCRKIEKLLAANQSMEVAIELYRSWVTLGNSQRLIPFDKLPKFPHLNPSIATFEAEQVRYDEMPDVMQYISSWNPVLINLPLSKWTTDLALAVLEVPDQLPNIKSKCLEALQYQNYEKLSEVASKYIDSSEASTVRQEALVLASAAAASQLDKDQYINYMWEFGCDEAPVESRRSVVRGIDTFLKNSLVKPPSEILYLLFRLLSDEEEDIRDSAAVTFCEWTESPVEAAAMCEGTLLNHMSKPFLTCKLLENLVEDATQALQSYNDSEEQLFAIEEESLFRNETRSIKLISQKCAKPTENQRKEVEKAREILSSIDRSMPFKSANKELVRVDARISALLK